MTAGAQLVERPTKDTGSVQLLKWEGCTMKKLRAKLKAQTSHPLRCNLFEAGLLFSTKCPNSCYDEVVLLDATDASSEIFFE